MKDIKYTAEGSKCVSAFKAENKSKQYFIIKQ